MIINIADSINSMLQSIMFIYVSNYCSKDKKSRLTMIVWTVILWSIIEATTIIFGNSSLDAILIHLIILISGAVIFKKDPLGAMIGFSMVYLAIAIVILICSGIYLGYIENIFLIKSVQIRIVIFMYIPQYILFILILCNMEFINDIYKILKSKSVSIVSLILITVFVDFMILFNGLSSEFDSPLFKEVLFIFLSVFTIGITIYFSIIEKKAKQILIANNFLEKKNEELKKIKHDYGAQISYLYGLYLMGKNDRLGAALKEIINGNDSISSDIEIIHKSDSIISDIVYGIDHKGINLIIDDQIDIDDISISELDYQRVISNILRNAITAMDGKGIIEIKTYYTLKYGVLKIKNNGPKIEENMIDKIFESGFSTKENRSKDNGFGLSIVKEIIDESKGSIELESNDMFTEFTIKIIKLRKH